MSSLAAIEAKLTGPGGPFETVEASVRGERMRVLKGRAPHLRSLLEKSRAHGDAPYLVYEDRRISFADHFRAAASVATALRDHYGVGKGDRVAILAANCPEWIVTYWATVSIGAIAVGMNGWWARDEIRYALADCEPLLLVGDAKRLARLESADVSAPVIEIESDYQRLWNYDRGATLPPAEIDEDDPAVILDTSGTTGRPKGAVNTHRNVVAVCALSFFHGVRMLMLAADDLARRGPPPHPNCTLVNSPLFHVSGLYTGAVTLLAGGVKSVWMSGRYDPERVMQVIERERVTAWGPLGTMAHRLVHHPAVAKYDLSSVRQVGSGGAPVSPELQQKMREVFPNARASMGLGYGLTEGTGMATIIFGADLLAHPESVGRPLPTIAIEIRDAEGRPVADGAEGEVYMRSPLVMREYWRRPEESRETILPGGWLRTGDVGRLEHGLLFIDSRKRDLILRGAENIYPAEIEQRLEAHPDVAEAAVVGVDHDELGQEVKAIVVPRDGARLDRDGLRQWVADVLASFKVPAHWEVRTAPLPRNAVGKVLKRLVADGAENRLVEE